MKFKVGDRVRLKNCPSGLNGRTGTIVYYERACKPVPWLVELDEPHSTAHRGGNLLLAPHTGWYVDEATAEVIEAAEPEEDE